LSPYLFIIGMVNSIGNRRYIYFMTSLTENVSEIINSLIFCWFKEQLAHQYFALLEVLRDIQLCPDRTTGVGTPSPLPELTGKKGPYNQGEIWSFLLLLVTLFLFFILLSVWENWDILRSERWILVYHFWIRENYFPSDYFSFLIFTINILGRI